ncbi:MAG: reverse transcriptase domain-containing protein [Pirellulaceae bacterium]|nr:reverse transcriptase domain-containing protein [Pirellulaceae bacterium]
MADPAAIQIIDQVVAERVAAGAMFTAYDVTVEARNRGARVKHDEARDRVHELFQRGTMGAAYARTAIDVGAPTRPFLYHPFSADPRGYRSPATGQAPQAPVQSPPAQAPARPGIVSRIVGAIFGSPGPPPNRPTQPWVPPPATRAPRASTPPPPSPPRQPQTLGLDAAQFLPISRDELLAAAQKINLWGSPWFGRRDLIPPAEDERTKLIDRALVSNGLLSPEQLAEIHRVGAEMDRVRPDLLALKFQASQAGAAAALADRAARQKLKAEKQAAAAQRKRDRADAVALRRATDIVFLGRGVSGRLGERTSDAAKLAMLGLPSLSTPAELAAALSVSVSELRWLAFHAEVATRTHYVHFTVPKRSGGVRTLSAPHRKLAKAQRWIFDSIVSKLPTEPCAHGFIRERSILTNAQAHVGRQVVVNMDLEAFFPSISFPRVRSVFHRLGYSPAVATILALLCTECPRKQVQFSGRTYFVATGPRGLPQGACTSPGLANQVARRLDKRLSGLAAKFQLAYTRDADDLTLSGNGEITDKIGYLMARVRHIAEDEGFAINVSKSRVQRRNTAQMVTGLVVNDRPSVPRSDLRRLRAILHRAKTEGLAAQNRAGKTNFAAWLDGMIAYVSMSRPDLGSKLRVEFESVSRAGS